MKKEKIYNIVTASICLSLWFMPIERTNYVYAFILRIFIESAQTGWLFTPIYLGELLLMLLGITDIITLIIHLLTDKLLTKIIASINTLAYTIMWIVYLFMEFPSRIPVYTSFVSGSHILWLIMYFIVFLTIIILQGIQYIQYFPLRHLNKAEGSQTQIDELQKQVDELHKGE